MNQETQEYYNIASWTKDKVNYNRVSKFNTNKHRQVLHGQIWFCDLGYNIGTEKNKSYTTQNRIWFLLSYKTTFYF